MATDTKNTKSLTGNRQVRYVLARSGGAYVVLGVTLLMTGLAWYWAYNNIQGHQSMHFEQVSLKTRSAIQQRMQAYTDVLYGVRALFYTSRAVTRSDFQDYVNTVGVVERYPESRASDSYGGSRITTRRPSSPRSVKNCAPTRAATLNSIFSPKEHVPSISSSI